MTKSLTLVVHSDFLKLHFSETSQKNFEKLRGRVFRRGLLLRGNITDPFQDASVKPSPSSVTSLMNFHSRDPEIFRRTTSFLMVFSYRVWRMFRESNFNVSYDDMILRSSDIVKVSYNGASRLRPSQRFQISYFSNPKKFGL